MNKIYKKNLMKKLIGSGIVLVVFFFSLYILFYSFGLTNISKEELQSFIYSTGAVAPLIYILITFLQVIIIPIPSAVTILVGCYLFGTVLSFIYSYIGLMLGSLVAYYLGKIAGKPFINWLSGGKEQTELWVSKLHGKENILLFFMFLFPMFPDDILCAIAGILPITTRSFIFMLIITRATTIGSTLLFMTGEIIPFNGWGITIIILAVILCFLVFIYCFKNGERINAKLKNPFEGKKESITNNDTQNN